MASNKELLRTGFYNSWRPVDGDFSSIDHLHVEKQSVSLTLHLDEALEVFKHECFNGRTFSEFSVLESLNLCVTTFRTDIQSINCNDNVKCFHTTNKSEGIHMDNVPDLGTVTTTDSILGNISFDLDIHWIMRKRNKQQLHIYFIEVVDMNDYSIVRLLVTKKKIKHYPLVDDNSKGSPIHVKMNQIFCLDCIENMNGKRVKCTLEFLLDCDIFDKGEIWEQVSISTETHKGHKRFRCNRVLKRESSRCVFSSREDSLAGIVAWMLIHRRYEIFYKLQKHLKTRLKAVHAWKLKKDEASPLETTSCSSLDIDSEMSISDIEEECMNSETNSQLSEDEVEHDSKLNAVCDYIAHAFYSSSSSTDLTSIQYALENCDLNVETPTKTEVKACLVLIMKSVKDTILQDEEINRRDILEMLPCDKFLKSRYESTIPCSERWCPHENCSDVIRIGLCYLLHTLNRWHTEDSAFSK